MSTADGQQFDDRELLDRLREGDDRAFSTIYQRYWMVMYSHAYRMLQDEEETRDVLQDSFAALWHKRQRLASSQNLRGLLYTTVRRKVLDVIAQKKVRTQYLDSLDAYLQQYSNKTAEDLDARALMEAFDREIQLLPPRMRAIFEMRVKQHQSYKEIAEALNLSDLTVKKQVSNAIKIIKFKLKAYVGWTVLLLFADAVIFFISFYYFLPTRPF